MCVHLKLDPEVSWVPSGNISFVLKGQSCPFRTKRRMLAVGSRTWRMLAGGHSDMENVGGWTPGYTFIPDYQMTTVFVFLLYKASHANKVNNVYKL